MFASVAFGQSDTTQLNTVINSNFPNNTSGFITPTRLRTVARELMRSCANFQEVNTFQKWAVFEDAVTGEDSIKSDVGFYVWNGVSYEELVACTQCVQTAKLLIPSAEVLTLNSTPKAFGLAVPAGYYVKPIEAVAQSTYGGTPYATNISMRIRAVGASNHLYALNLNYSADIFTQMGVQSAGGVKYVGAADIETYVDTGDPTAGDSDITIYLTYILVQL
jgi:hypothetical protein